jgi:hypothetical protein
VVNTPDGYPGGCAVNPKTGDLAVALFAGGYKNIGSVVIYAGGIAGSPTAYNATEFTWPPAYDGHGNLYVEGEDGFACPGPGPTCIWTLQAGSTTPQGVNWKGGSFEYPGAIEPNGKMLMFGQQQYNNQFETAIFPTQCSGTNCDSKTPVVLTDTCYKNDTDIVQWAQDSSAIAGGNLYCSDENPYYVYMKTWKRSGGDPTGSFGPPPYSAYGQTIVK